MTVDLISSYYSLHKCENRDCPHCGPWNRYLEAARYEEWVAAWRKIGWHAGIDLWINRRDSTHRLPSDEPCMRMNCGNCLTLFYEYGSVTRRECMGCKKILCRNCAADTLCANEPGYGSPHIFRLQGRT